MTSLERHGRIYGVDSTVFPDDGIKLWANGNRHLAENEEEAVKWLCSHSLRRGKARALVKLELARHVPPTVSA